MAKMRAMENELLGELFEVKARKGDFKKREIILATIDCIYEVGVEHTTYEAIAQKVNTRRAHVAYYFKDKKQLIIACVRYIVGNYQQDLLNSLKNAKGGRGLLTAYLEGPFVWAKKNPAQLSVMLLFYYMCLVRPELKKLHERIRSGGVERIQFILVNHLNFSTRDANIVAKMVQNMISGYMIDAVTTTGRTLDMALEDLKKDVIYLVEASIEKNQEKKGRTK